MTDVERPLGPAENIESNNQDIVTNETKENLNPNAKNSCEQLTNPEKDNPHSLEDNELNPDANESLKLNPDAKGTASFENILLTSQSSKPGTSSRKRHLFQC